MTMLKGLRGGLLAIALLGALASLTPVNASNLEPVMKKLSDPRIHCGQKPTLDLVEGVMNALADPQATAANLSLSREDRKLELLIHFEQGSSNIPENCLEKLGKLNESVKSGRSGPILLRSHTRTQASTELDLALASQRLDSVKSYLRDNRLARRAFIVELHPEASSPLLGDAVDWAHVIEVYSSPAN